MAKITFRSYDIGQEGAENFEDVLQRISGLPRSQRDRHLTDDYIVRLVRYERPDNGDIVFGEFIRIRERNFPAVITDQGNGINPLPLNDEDNENIGQGAAFLYKIQDNLLYMQCDNRIVATSRAIKYVNEFANGANFSAEIRISDDAWRRLDDGLVRNVEIGIASHDNFAGIADYDDAMMGDLTSVGRRVRSSSISVKFSMGHNRGALHNGVKGMMRTIRELAGGGLFSLNSLKASVKEADDVPAETINLIDDILSTKEDIDFPRNNPDVNYRRRKRLLEDLMNRNAL